MVKTLTMITAGLLLLATTQSCANNKNNSPKTAKKAKESIMKTGFAKETINPEKGVPLIGQFGRRLNQGVRDDLCVKTVLFEKNGKIGGIVSFDLLFVQKHFIAAVRKRLEEEKVDFGNDLLFCATHTHTGPNIPGPKPTIEKINEMIAKTKAAIETMKDDDPKKEAYKKWLKAIETREKESANKQDYRKYLIDQTVNSIKKAYANLGKSSLLYGSVMDNPFAFNRRYWMKNGTVRTNPGRLNPNIVKPEGPVDMEIGVLAVKKNGKISLIIANIANHADSTGGYMVCAGWPGRLEKRIQEKMGYDVPVITIIAPSGNINHYDVFSKTGYTNYQVIGKGYGDIVMKEMGSLKKVKGDFNVKNQTIEIVGCEISDKDAEAAKKTIENKKASHSSKILARDLINFKKNNAGKVREFELVTLKFGKDLAITSIPGEPFTEIGINIKKAAPFKKTFVVSHAMGSAGYIPIKECFGRGGYELQPRPMGGCAPDTADMLIEKSLEALK
jgi:hypothetical protein